MRSGVGNALLLAVLAPCLAAAAPDLRFEPETLTLSQRVRAGSPPALAMVDHRLTLAAPIPRGAQVLRLDQPRFAPCRGDQGERIALFVRPLPRKEMVLADRLQERDRMVRLILDIVPPRRDCSSLEGIEGSLSVLFAQGPIQRTELPARIGASATCGQVEQDRAQVEEAKDGQATVQLPQALADRLAGIETLDAAGGLLPARVRPAPGKVVPGQLRYQLRWEPPGPAASLRLNWYQGAETVLCRIVLPRIDIPGGLPGTGGLALPKPASLPRDPLRPPLLTAILSADLPGLARLVREGADPLAALPDGRTPLQAAWEARRWDAIQTMLNP